MNIENIIHEQLSGRSQRPERDYRQTPAINASALVAGLCGDELDPYAVKHAFENERPSTISMDSGSLAHLAILEPHTLSQRVAVWAEGRRAGKAYDDFCDQNHGKLIMRKKDFDDVMIGAAVAATNPQVRTLLAGCDIETSLFWNEGPIACKGRLDSVSKELTPMGFYDLVDIKTTHAIDRLSCERTVRGFHYREKMAWYRRGLCKIHGIDREQVRCFLVFVKLSPPYGVSIVKLLSDGLGVAEMRMLNMLAAVQDAIQRQSFMPLVQNHEMGVDPWDEEEISV